MPLPELNPGEEAFVRQIARTHQLTPAELMAVIGKALGMDVAQPDEEEGDLVLDATILDPDQALDPHPETELARRRRRAQDDEDEEKRPFPKGASASMTVRRVKELNSRKYLSHAAYRRLPTTRVRRKQLRKSA